jgi:hypothetical protein
MKKRLLLILCLFIFTSCYETKTQAYSSRRSLMLVESNDIPKNKPLKYSKSKTKKAIHKNFIKKQKQQRRK